LINITDRLAYEEVAETSLWQNIDNEWPMLNILYRIHALSTALDVHFLELFTLFDLLEKDPFVGRYDPHNRFIYRAPSSHKCAQIFLAGNSDNVNDQLWLLESLTVLNTWMKEYGYSAPLLWKIANGAPNTDAQEQQQDSQELALYNSLLAGFNAQELSPASFGDLGDERAANFAYKLVKHRCGEKNSIAYQKMDGMGADWLYHKNMGKLIKSKTHDMASLTKDFLSQLEHIHHKEFVGLSLGDKLQQKILRNLVIHQIIDGDGVLISKDIINSGEATQSNFSLEYDTSSINTPLQQLLHNMYVEAAGQVQIFKSDLQDLGLTVAQASELYDTLIFNGYIDEEGKAVDPQMFADANEPVLNLSIVTWEMQHRIMAHFNYQLRQFSASKVHIDRQLFADLDIDPEALDNLMVNLQQNDYLDAKGLIIDPLRIATQTPDTMQLPARYYPQRQAIYDIFKQALADNQAHYLAVNQVELQKYCNKVASQWAHEDIQDDYLSGYYLTQDGRDFFGDEENQSELVLGDYFDESQRHIIFNHIGAILSYANSYKLTDEALLEIGFSKGESAGFKDVLSGMGILSDSVLQSDKIDFFKSPQNADNFTIPGFEDYDREIFFALHALAKSLDHTVTAIEDAVKEKGMAQQQAVLAQLEGSLGINTDAISMLSKAIFKTQNDLHLAWLAPLFRSANVLATLDELPGDMVYTQNVKRIGQFAELVKKLQLDNDEIAIALNDQELVAKFPEDLILPDDPVTGEPISSIDTLLETPEFIYIFKADYYWVYQAQDYRLIDKKVVVAGASDIDDDLLEWQKQDEDQQKRLKEDPIRQLFDEQNLSQVDAAIIDKHETWCIITGADHYVRYAGNQHWDRRDNAFGQVDNDFENLEMIDAAYVDEQGRLFLINNDKYLRYSDTHFIPGGGHQPAVDSGYPKLISEDWNDENLPIQLPEDLDTDLGPMFNGTDGSSYAFFGDEFLSSIDDQIHQVSDQWGHREHDFGAVTAIDAAMTENGSYLLFSDDKVVKYNASLEQYAGSFNFRFDSPEMKGLQPEAGYPKPIAEHFSDLPDQFVCDIDAALEGLDGNTYLFHDDDCVTISEVGDGTNTAMAQTKTQWGIINNSIADSGTVNAAFIGLDGRTYLFSGSQYVRYSSSDYSEVDDGFPRDISEDWQGLTSVTAAFILGNKTYLFGRDGETENLYVRYSTVSMDEDDYLEVDHQDPNARTIETVLANRADVDDIEVFGAVVNQEFWSLPQSVTGGAEDFQIDAVMNGPDGKVYLFYGENYIEHDHLNRWWSEPKVLRDQWSRTPAGLTNVVAGFTSKEGQTFLFFDHQFLRFSDQQLLKLDNGYPRPTDKFWGKVRNNIDHTGQVDAALVVESRWQDAISKVSWSTSLKTIPICSVATSSSATKAMIIRP
jgi:hypothetical protein